MKNILYKISKIGLLRFALICSLLDIIIFVNFNDSMNKQEFKLMFYIHIFIIVMAFIKEGWIRHNEVITRSLLIALGFYWLFEIVMQIISVVNYDLYLQFYKGKTINYVLALSCGCSLAILPLINKLKKWIKAKASPSLKK